MDKREKYPVIYGKDSGPSCTVGDVAREIVDKLEEGDEDAACDVVDEKFIYGSWGFLLANTNNLKDAIYRQLRKDLRGLLIAVYREGRHRGTHERKPTKDRQA